MLSRLPAFMSPFTWKVSNSGIWWAIPSSLSQVKDLAEAIDLIEAKRKADIEKHIIKFKNLYNSLKDIGYQPNKYDSFPLYTNEIDKLLAEKHQK